VTRSGPLIVEPDAGFSPVYRLINGAAHSIDVTMYERSDQTAEHDLTAAAKRGVRVRVILDPPGAEC
jgi:cardiolipin synthase